MDLSISNSHRDMFLLVRVSGIPIPWIKFSSLAKILWTIYDILVLMFSAYIISCVFYSIGTRVEFQELCKLGIVLCQMTNGILVTFYYLLNKKRMVAVEAKMDTLTQRVLNSPLGNQDSFISEFKKGRDIITLFTRVSVVCLFVSSALYTLPIPFMDYLASSYRTRLPLQITFLGQPDYNKPVVFEVTILQEVFVLFYSCIKKHSNDCIFLSFFKMQLAYFKYLILTLRSSEVQLGNSEGNERQKRLNHWISLHQDVLKVGNELVSMFAPVIVLFYTNLLCIIALGLFVQLKADNIDATQSLATGLWVGSLVFVLFLQSALADELRTEAEGLAVAAYFMPWHQMKKDMVHSLKLIILRTNHPSHITAYRANAFILNKETFLGFITNVITAYMGFSKIDEILRETQE